MSYLILDEQLLGLEEFIEDLKVYRKEYKNKYLK